MQKSSFATRGKCLLLCLALLASSACWAQPGTPPLWHSQPRSLRYHPEGQDFVITNGTHRFNRALYGTHTAFRVEAGDLPEVALYLPGMGGNLRFGLLANSQSKWLIKAENITARYRPGALLYDITDPMLGAGRLHLEVLAMADAEGVLVKAQFENAPPKVELLWTFGGATGKKFSRDGDIGADPESSFYLKPEYCQGNAFTLKDNAFTLTHGTPPPAPDTYRDLGAKAAPANAPTAAPVAKLLVGTGPLTAKTHVGDAARQESPAQLWASVASATPVLVGTVAVRSGEALYFAIRKPETKISLTYKDLPTAFAQAEAARATLAGRVQVSTPDPYVNTLGGALAVAADGIWEEPSYLHGAVAWRLRLNGWRGPYVADPLGWADRAAQHFKAYAQSQLTTPASGPVEPDTALHLARQREKLGTAVFSSGYVSRNPGGDFRAHHYDMNLVYVDALLRHLRWTGDLAQARELWPTLQRHLAWEKRNFDPDGDGLYDAYAAIWASDALQYSGGAVTHSSAYNYFANQQVAELAELLHEDPAPYRAEAARIHAAMQARLWLPQMGHYAEYQDGLGMKALHPAAGLWTIYHTLDSEVPDALGAYQATRYVDAGLPHIPVRAAGLPDAGYYLLSTTNWQPYDWSLNNVVLAENLHMALGYWQASRPDAAFLLWKSALLESMYLGSSPGNFQQISFYDANRGELYRDFADPIGMAARSLVEGLFGIRPDALHGTLLVRPGLPAAWDSASLTVPDVTFRYRRLGQRETYTLAPRFARPLALRLQVPALAVGIASVQVNGQTVAWQNIDAAVGRPEIEISSPPAGRYVVEIAWQGAAPVAPAPARHLGRGERLVADVAPATALALADPQQVVAGAQLTGSQLAAQTQGQEGSRALFVQVEQGSLSWWQPLRVELEPRTMPASPVPATPATWETVDLTTYYNDQVTRIFQNRYLTPRSPTATLALPTQGLGNWCYPLMQANIDDSGLRQLAGPKSEIQLPTGVPLRTPGAAGAPNILFVSQWDNYPRQATLPLRGRASRAVLLLAGTTNPMQSQLTNGEVTVTYTDGTAATLPLRNPDTWWPIEQDYLNDGFAFQTNAPPPYRVHLKTGLVTHGDFDHYTSLKGYSTRAIDGGAATVLELPLDPRKKLKSLTVRALANDVVIGLMSVTLGRN